MNISHSSNRHGLKLLAAISVAVAIAGVAPDRADAACLAGSCVVYTDPGTNNMYEITTETGTFNSFSNLTTNFWWGNSTKARSVAISVGNSLGLPNYAGLYSPYFAYSSDGVSNVLSYDVNATGILYSSSSHPQFYAGTYAIATPVAANVPEPDGIVGTLVAIGTGLVVRRKLAQVQTTSPRTDRRS